MDLLSVAQVASRLSVAPSTVRQWIKDRKLSALRGVGRGYRIRPDALASWLCAAEMFPPYPKPRHKPRSESRRDRAEILDFSNVIALPFKRRHWRGRKGR